MAKLQNTTVKHYPLKTIPISFLLLIPSEKVTQAHPQNAFMSPGIEETEGKEATNDKVTPSSEYIPS